LFRHSRDSLASLIPGETEACRDQSLAIGRIARRVQNSVRPEFYNASGTHEWEQYKAEDVLEIFDVSKREAYIRLHLEFDNAHACNIWGVASFANDTLTYHTDRLGNVPVDCTLSLKMDYGKLRVSDLGEQCRKYTCGARGAYSNAVFDISTKRKIRYSTRIKNSRQYQEAMQERDAHK